MDKKNRTAFKGFLHENQKADFAGENPAVYLAPEVSVSAFALEKGFALSVATEQFNLGFPASEGMENGDYNDYNGTTESLEGGFSF